MVCRSIRLLGIGIALAFIHFLALLRNYNALCACPVSFCARENKPQPFSLLLNEHFYIYALARILRVFCSLLWRFIRCRCAEKPILKRPLLLYAEKCFPFSFLFYNPRADEQRGQPSGAAAVDGAVFRGGHRQTVGGQQLHPLPENAGAHARRAHPVAQVEGFAPRAQRLLLGRGFRLV